MSVPVTATSRSKPSGVTRLRDGRQSHHDRPGRAVRRARHERAGRADDSLVEMRIVDGIVYMHYPRGDVAVHGRQARGSASSGDDELRSTSSGIGPFGQARSAAVPRLPRHGLVGRRRSRRRDASATSTRRTTTPSIDFDRRRSTSCPTRSSSSASTADADQQLDAMRDPSAATSRSTSGSTATDCCAGCAWTCPFERRSTMSMVMDLDDYGVAVDVEAPPADQVDRPELGARRPRRRPWTATDPRGPPPNLAGVEPVTPSVGWGVLHLFYRVDRERAEREPGAAQADRRRGRVARGRRPPGAAASRCSATRPTSA